MSLLNNLVHSSLSALGLSAVRSHQTYDADRAATIKRHRTDLIIDVGANAGQYAIKLRKSGYLGAIVSVEPLPDAYAALEAAMKGDSKWRGFNAAAGAERTKSTLNVSEDSVCSSLLSPSSTLLDAIPTARTIGSVKVDVIPLDDLEYPSSRSSWLKLDVQGFERQALEGATKILASVRVLELELGLKPSYEESYTLEKALPRLNQMGFSVVSLGRGVSDSESGQLIDVDVLLERS